MMGKNAIRQPIFFIGVPRSGTTVIFESFACHEDLGGPTFHTLKYPKWPIAGVLFPLFDNRFGDIIFRNTKDHRKVKRNRILPKPDEAYPFWDHYTGLNFSRHYLHQQKADEACRDNVRRAVARMLCWQRKERFAAKMTGPSRICFLRSIFPDAKFVHVIRDGRAVVNSLLKVPFWREGGGFQSPWWQGYLPEEYLRKWRASNKDAGVLAAVQWRQIIETARKEKDKLPSEQYIEIKYEEFIDNPHDVLSDLYKQCNLSDSKRVHEYLDKGQKITNMNYKYKTGLSTKSIKLITDAMKPLLTELGYACPS